MTHQTLTLRDGRLLAFATSGDVSGVPLYFFHGFPGSRLQAALVAEQARSFGICLVAPDRPGFGYSTPDPDRTMLSWTRDVLALADHLGHARFEIMGISCGGAYALACAHELGARVRGTYLMAGMGPMDIPAIRRTQLPVLSIMFGLAPRVPMLISPLLMLDRIMYRRNPRKAVAMVSKMLSEPDRRSLTSDPELAAAFGESLADAYRQGIGGALKEAALIGSPRPYRLEAIVSPVHILQGHWDRHVPLEMGRYLATQISNAGFHDFPDEGHLSIVPNQFALVAQLMGCKR